MRDRLDVGGPMMGRTTDEDFGLSLLSSMYHQDWIHAGGHLEILRIFLWDG